MIMILTMNVTQFRLVGSAKYHNPGAVTAAGVPGKPAFCQGYNTFQMPLDK